MLSRLIDTMRSLFLPPRRLPNDGLTHGVYLVISSVLVVAPFFLSCSHERDAKVSIGGYSLPATCPSKLAGVECPGCGMTHAFVLISHGQLRDSVRWNRVGVLLYVYFAMQVVFRGWALYEPKLRVNERAAAFQYYTSSTIILLLLGNWIAALFLGANGS